MNRGRKDREILKPVLNFREIRKAKSLPLALIHFLSAVHLYKINFLHP